MSLKTSTENIPVPKQFLETLVKNGNSINKICGELGYTHHTIKKYIKIYNLPYRLQSTVIPTDCPNVKKLESLVNKKIIFEDIAQHFGVSKSLICSWCKKYHISVINNPHQKIQEPAKEKLKELYEKGMTFVAIGKRFGVSNVTVKKWFLNFHLPFRTRSQTQQITTISGQATKLKKYGYSSFPPDLIPPKHSKGELAIQEFLNSLGFNFLHAKIDNYHIDLYDEKHKFAIEYNGDFWHTEQFKEKYLHFEKYKHLKEKNIRLITIKESEWETHQEQIKGFLKAQLGCFEQRLFARNCQIKKIDLEYINLARDFLDQYHIQGATNSIRIAYGIYHKDDLLGIVSFGIHHRKKSEIVLNRLCFKTGIQVVGGASKLIKTAIKLENLNNIITWSDNRWSTGNIYKSVGFTKEHEIRPDYSYVKRDKTKSKQSMQKTKIGCPREITEKAFCEQQGWYRLWDCGKIRWRYVTT